MKINDKGNIEIDPEEIFGYLDIEEKKELIKHLVLHEDVIQWVLNYICGEDEDGWWIGIDKNIRYNFLCKVESSLIDDLKKRKLGWQIWDEIVHFIKYYKSQKHLYYKLWNIENQSMTIGEFLRRNGEENEFQTKQADEKIKELEEKFNEVLDKFDNKS